MEQKEDLQAYKVLVSLLNEMENYVLCEIYFSIFYEFEDCLVFVLQLLDFDILNVWCFVFKKLIDNGIGIVSLDIKGDPHGLGPKSTRASKTSRQILKANIAKITLAKHIRIYITKFLHFWFTQIEGYHDS